MNKSIWDLSPDTKNKFPAPFPVELPFNCIKACCPEGGIVLDPYMGSGTTGIASKRLGMNFIGIDINKEYCEKAKERINASKSGNTEKGVKTNGRKRIN